MSYRRRWDTAGKKTRRAKIRTHRELVDMPRRTVSANAPAFFIFAVFITLFPFVFSRDTKSSFILPKQLLFAPTMWLIATVWAAGFLKSKSIKMVFTPLYFVVCLFLFVCFLSSLFGEPFFESSVELKAWLAAGLGFFLAVNLFKTEFRQFIVLAGLGAAGVFQSVWGIVQFIGRDKILAFENAAIGTTGNSNYFGGLLAMFIFPLLGAGLYSWKRLDGSKKTAVAVISASALTIVIVGLLVSDCQSAYIGATAGAVVFGLAIAWKKKVGVGKFISRLLIVISAVFVVLAGSRLITGKSPMIFANLGERATWGRVLMWKTTLLMIKDYPILGTGIGTYQNYYLPYLSKLLDGKDIKPILNIIQNAEKTHNAYLQIWSETGSAGFTAFLAILLVFFVRCYKHIKLLERDEDHFLILGSICGMVAFLTTIPFSSLLVIAPLREYFWLFLGITEGFWASKLMNKEWEIGEKNNLFNYPAVVLFLLCLVGLFLFSAHSRRMYRANVLWEQGVRASDRLRFDEALACYDKALELTPSQHKLLFYRGSVYVRIADDAGEPDKTVFLQRGIRDLTEAVKGFQDVNLYTNLANAYAQLGDADKRVYWAKRAAATGLNYELTKTSYAVALITAGGLSEAQKELEDVLKVFPHSGMALFHLGRVYLKKEEHEKVVEMFKKFTETQPGNPEGHINLGLALMAMNDMASAEKEFLIALEIAPSNTVAMINLGLLYLKTGRADLARKEWEAVLAIDPANPVARRNLEALGRSLSGGAP